MTLEIVMASHAKHFDSAARLTPGAQVSISSVIIVPIISIIHDKKMRGWRF
jgi:hypothetical protein